MEVVVQLFADRWPWILAVLVAGVAIAAQTAIQEGVRRLFRRLVPEDAGHSEPASSPSCDGSVGSIQAANGTSVNVGPGQQTSASGTGAIATTGDVTIIHEAPTPQIERVERAPAPGVLSMYGTPEKAHLERDRDDAQARRRIVGHITAARHSLAQLYVTRLEAWIHSDVHERNWQLDGCPTDSLDLEEARRWTVVTNEKLVEIERAIFALHSAVAEARIVFPSSDETDRLLTDVLELKALGVTSMMPLVETREGVRKHAASQTEKLRKTVKEKIEMPIRKLADHLATQARLLDGEDT